jgi:hypothetical protein
MATYVNDLRLKEIATGDESGTWGTSTNTNLELIADAFSYATKDCFASDADATETMADGVADEIRSLYLKVTSSATLTATRTLTLAPNTVSKTWIIENATTGGQSINISQGSGANVTIPNGDTKIIYTDGAGAGAAVTDAFASLNVGDLTATNIAGTLTTAAQPNITSLGTLTGLTSSGALNLNSAAGYGNIEIGGASGGKIDFKTPFSDDYDARIIYAGSNFQILTNADQPILLRHNNSTVLTTSSSGIDVTGTATMDGLTVDTSTLVVDSTNNRVGIGTTSPTELLEISANALHRVLITATDTTMTSGADYGGIGWETNDASQTGLTTWEIFQEAAGTTGEVDLVFDYKGTEAVRLDTSGSVGINTSDIDAILHVKDDAAANDNFDVLIEGFRPNLVFEDISGSATDFQLFVDSNRLDFLYGDASTDTKLANTVMSIDSTGAEIREALTVGSSNNSLGTTAGDQLTPLTLQSDTANTDKLFFTTERLSNGADWTTAAHRIQRKVDASLMGYMQFGSSASDLITFGENASEYVRIDGAGNFGINTTSPATLLHIKADSNSATDFPLTIENAADSLDVGIGAYGLSNKVGTSQTSDFTMTIGDDLYLAADTVRLPDGADLIVQENDSTTSAIRLASDADEGFLQVYRAGVQKVQIRGNGDNYIIDNNFGIGQSAPTQQLVVKDATDYHGILVHGNNAPNISFDRGDTQTPEWKVGVSGNVGTSFAISKGTSNDDKLIIDSSGFVGINTTSPDTFLNVEGSRTVPDTGAGSIFNSTITPSNNDAASIVAITGTINASASMTAASKISGLRVKPTFPSSMNGSGHCVGIKIDAFDGKSSTIGAGIYAEATTGADTNYAGYFSGNINVTGSVSKGSGSFRIDHPLESKTDTHHLVHSFVEAPQADNIYRGKVDLVDGSATVNIDTVAGMTEGTFVALNRDVQCFTTNESNWDAVKGSVSGNILTIESQNSESTATISWLVIGERQDQHMYDTDWTDENGKVIVEPLKTNEE